MESIVVKLRIAVRMSRIASVRENVHFSTGAISMLGEVKEQAVSKQVECDFKGDSQGEQRYEKIWFIADKWQSIISGKIFNALRERG